MRWAAAGSFCTISNCPACEQKSCFSLFWKSEAQQIELTRGPGDQRNATS